MRLLLDTHVMAWWMLDDARLTRHARESISLADEVCVSAVSGYEMAQKFRLGKWPEAAPFMEGFSRSAAASSFVVLDVIPEHAVRAGLLPSNHRDPFDRLLVAQAMVEGLRIVSADTALKQLGVEPLWT